MSLRQQQCNSRSGDGCSTFPVGLSPLRQLFGVLAIAGVWWLGSGPVQPVDETAAAVTASQQQYRADIIEDIIDVIEKILGGGG